MSNHRLHNSAAKVKSDKTFCGKGFMLWKLLIVNIYVGFVIGKSELV